MHNMTRIILYTILLGTKQMCNNIEILNFTQAFYKPQWSEDMIWMLDHVSVSGSQPHKHNECRALG